MSTHVTPEGQVTPDLARRALGIALAVYGGYALAGWVGVPGEARALALVAAFYFVPGWVLRKDPDRARRWQVGPESPIPPWSWRGARVAAWAAALVFPPFIVGFVWFYARVCAGDLTWVSPLVTLEGWTPWAGSLEGFLGGLCRDYGGTPGLSDLRVPEAWRAYGGLGTVYYAAIELLVVALPEEVFHRGFLMSALEARWPPRRRVGGVPFGLAAVLSSAVFAVGHLVGMAQAGRLATFAPGLLFAWLWKRSGSLWAPALFHAASNLLMNVLLATTFPGGS